MEESQLKQLEALQGLESLKRLEPLQNMESLKHLETLHNFESLIIIPQIDVDHIQKTVEQSLKSLESLKVLDSLQFTIPAINADSIQYKASFMS